ncbi:DUF2004 domain-containing protein [Ruminococcaceae bacterium OttesenSCG-928-L11]|nr:DUF2004 domain-containing protein [Ruminococcaceae bacterium OttesenSCG-928-L11]
MKSLPSKLFPGCTFSPNKDVGFYDITPAGFEHVISLYLGRETVKEDAAIGRAAVFFDRAAHWDTFCREAFLAAEEGGEDEEMIAEYFDFYREEVPEVFGVEDVSALSLPEMVKSLTLAGMATHGSGPEQRFNVDFTLGYDQLLCVYFNSDGEFDRIAWES